MNNSKILLFCQQILHCTIFAFALIILSPTEQLFAEYELIDLGTLGGAWTAANDINNHNQVVGSAQRSSSTSWSPFLWQDRIMTELEPSVVSSAPAISDSGYVLVDRDSSYSFGCFSLWQVMEGWNMRLDGIQPPIGNNCYARDVNSAGQVLGYFAGGAGNDDAAFIYHDDNNNHLVDPTEVMMLPSPGNFTIAKKINELGEVGGHAIIPGSSRHAIFWGMNRQPIDLGTLPGDLNSSINSMNEMGTLIGCSNASGNTTACGQPVKWTRSDSGFSISALPQLPGALFTIPNAINNAGYIVGSANMGAGVPTRACLWNNQGEVFDLNQLAGLPSGSLRLGTGINDHGVIIVYGTGGHSYLLVPNGAPVLNPIGSRVVNEGSLLSFDVSATDHDQNSLILTTASNLPITASFVDHHDGTGTFSWRPPITHNAPAFYVVLFKATNGIEISDWEAILIRVNNSRPVVRSVTAVPDPEPEP